MADVRNSMINALNGMQEKCVPSGDEKYILMPMTYTSLYLIGRRYWMPQINFSVNMARKALLRACEMW